MLDERLALAHEALACRGDERHRLGEQHPHRVAERDRLLVDRAGRLHLRERGGRQLDRRVQRQRRELLALRLLHRLRLLLGELTQAAQQILWIAAERKAHAALFHALKASEPKARTARCRCSPRRPCARALRTPASESRRRRGFRTATREVALVDELEVEERGDVRLAVREPDGRAELLRLRRGIHGAPVVLDATVGTRFPTRAAALEAVLEVPDRDAAGAGERLRRALERVAQRRRELPKIALADRARPRM